MTLQPTEEFLNLNLNLLRDLHLFANQNILTNNLYLFICANITFISEIAHAHPFPLSCLSLHFLPRQQFHPLLIPFFARGISPRAGEVAHVLSVLFLLLLVGAHHMEFG